MTELHVEITKYDNFLLYLMAELAASHSENQGFASEALIECLIKHRELTRGPRVWSPAQKRYVHLDHSHRAFASLRAQGPAFVRFTDKLLPLYCILCFLTDSHEAAHKTAIGILAKLQKIQTEPRVCGQPAGTTLSFEIRCAQYIADNLSAQPPTGWGEACQLPDVSVDTKVALDLLWSHLVLVYAGNRKLLLYNVDKFLASSLDSTTLCPRELRAALFSHTRHDISQFRNGPNHTTILSVYAKTCPVSQPSRGDKRRKTKTGRMFESKVARLCWLAALWALDFSINRETLHWLYKPEICRS